MWRTVYERISLISGALATEQNKIEASLHSYYSLKAKEPELYINYLPDKEPGPFDIKHPCEWSKKDRETLVAVIQMAASQRHAMSIWARVLLSGKDAKGNAISLVGRADVKIAQRIATALPEKHPARKVKPKERAVVFYEEE
jgi:hypothetical protein